MPKKKLKPSEVLQKAIRESDLSLYRLALDAGIGYASLHRFVHGERSVSLDVFDKLCECLGLELRAPVN
jgi:plasmid maintenance system antidote protein VapI